MQWISLFFQHLKCICKYFYNQQFFAFCPTYWISFVTVHSAIVFLIKYKHDAALVKFGRPQMANLLILCSFIRIISFCSCRPSLPMSLCVLKVCWQAGNSLNLMELKRSIFIIWFYCYVSVRPTITILTILTQERRNCQLQARWEKWV